MGRERLEASRWDRGDAYIGADMSDTFAPFGTHRDADPLQRSNFRVALAALEKVEAETTPKWDDDGDPDDRGPYVQTHEYNHWAVDWTRLLHIRDDAPAAILDAAEALLGRQEGYPILDDDDFAGLEMEEAEEIWRSSTVRDRVEIVQRYGEDCSIFAARRAEMPCGLNYSDMLY